ncbi:uncharacterized protein LOC111262689 isoform X2 [Varroa jacobsoni]|nr:uncharacterized protein LOC111246723 isoform X2 [Varroa destructor]XP_022652519.1 uncharacterized protein LOC111246723 isoform X2 [Varroa destructor]XP_022652520.1 uncharacterized protein LOC111246723 isoform X2 [Varroa destructor]XP_022652521.1 uncharacterized protein LOC111246723 isoform X2 [Varroa destructor]XP_022652523.1 uncharacterized protein LOC111246723 isoform X2 [Varroa destructor]XP_022692856.1 uncharacterized protein LOC111262689 isoform X2 [Varroa jacobsoni]XP_022692857.1 unc
MASRTRLLPQSNTPTGICGGNPSFKDSTASFPCPHCPTRVYRSQAALNVHRRTIHGVSDNSTQSVPCQEPSCSKTMQTISELRSHLTKDHGLQLKKVDSEFPNMKAFARWKEQVEQCECVCFIAKRSKNLPTERQHYYYCQRSWACRNSANVKNGRLTPMAPKSEETDCFQDEPPAKRKNSGVSVTDIANLNKGNPASAIRQLLCDKPRSYVHCTAHLTVREDLRTGRISVTGCLTHYAHSMTSRHFVEAMCRRSRVGRLKEGGVAGSEPVDISSVEDRLLAIYELAATKKKQKSVDKIRAALQDLFDCLKDYDEDDETLPGLEETRAWRQSAAQEEAERKRTNGCQNSTTGNCTASSSAGAGSTDTTNSSNHIRLASVSTQRSSDTSQMNSAPSSVSQTSVATRVANNPPLPSISLGQTTESTERVTNVASRDRGSSTETNDTHLWGFQRESVVVTTIAHG